MLGTCVAHQLPCMESKGDGMGQSKEGTGFLAWRVCGDERAEQGWRSFLAWRAMGAAAWSD